MKSYQALVATTLFLVACGGGDTQDAAPATTEAAPAAPAAAAPVAGPSAARPSGELMTPDWFTIDQGAQTVSMTLTAGATSANNYWNMNGSVKGELAVTVPAGFTINITLENKDPVMAHSVGISPESAITSPMPPAEAVFEGAISENAQSLTQAVLSGESETITFVANEAGNYVILCYVPGHGVIGMWAYFTVSADGSAGVQGAM